MTFCKHCQVFQLHIGPLSFRLEQEHCELLCEMMHSVYSQWLRPEAVANEELNSATPVNDKNH